MKKLYRSNDNKIVAGILGGIGEYTAVDPTIVRLIFIIITVISGFVPGLVTYFIALLVVPPQDNKPHTFE